MVASRCTHEPARLARRLKHYFTRAGNLVDDGQLIYRYDAWNRLVKVRAKQDDVTIQTAAYDGTGRRIKKVVDNRGDLEGTEVYYYDGWKVVKIRVGSTTMNTYDTAQLDAKPSCRTSPLIRRRRVMLIAFCGAITIGLATFMSLNRGRPLSYWNEPDGLVNRTTDVDVAIVDARVVVALFRPAKPTDVPQKPVQILHLFRWKTYLLAPREGMSPFGVDDIEMFANIDRYPPALAVTVIGIHACVFLIIAAATTLLVLVGPIRSLSRFMRGRCVRCGYWLVNLPSARCPECGLIGPRRHPPNR